MTSPEPLRDALNDMTEETTQDSESSFLGPYTPIPASSSATTRKPTSYLPLVADQRATSRLLERILERGGISVAECARRLGVSDSSLRQYTLGKRANPSLQTFLKICAACEVKVMIEI